MSSVKNIIKSICEMKFSETVKRESITVQGVFEGKDSWSSMVYSILLQQIAMYKRGQIFTYSDDNTKVQCKHAPCVALVSQILLQLCLPKDMPVWDKFSDGVCGCSFYHNSAEIDGVYDVIKRYLIGQRIASAALRVIFSKLFSMNFEMIEFPSLFTVFDFNTQKYTPTHDIYSPKLIERGTPSETPSAQRTTPSETPSAQRTTPASVVTTPSASPQTVPVIPSIVTPKPANPITQTRPGSFVQNAWANKLIFHPVLPVTSPKGPTENTPKPTPKSSAPKSTTPKSTHKSSVTLEEIQAEIEMLKKRTQEEEERGTVLEARKKEIETKIQEAKADKETKEKIALLQAKKREMTDAFEKLRAAHDRQDSDLRKIENSFRKA